MNAEIVGAPARAGFDRRTLIFAALAALVGLMMVLNLRIGSISYTTAEILDALANPGATSDLAYIVWNIRLPRTISAVLGGAFLATSGLLLQVYFRNPIVGPFILGISSGATVMVSLVMLTSLGLGFGAYAPFLNTISACIGAYAVTLLVVAIAARVKSGVTLLIVGLMTGYLCGAFTSILTALAEKDSIKGFVLWQMGSFSGFKWIEVWLLAGVGGVVLGGIHLLAKPLNAFLLGEDYAASMGVDIRRFRVLILLAASSLAGLVTALAGSVAFIGLAIPHMARLVLRTADNRVLVPGACLMGALVTSLCDLIARMWLSPVELPLSAITAFFGAPIVIGLLLKRGVR
ncbi:Transport system permease protein [uncultured Alphaproteobacteria bacterium]|uniref:Transport system permease protein n=1 Tax=uncultured Alphaproteobacteria bacterium TaxID=91750 RepID=A0A212ITS6_9PROT|nr:Transport system permease protein [uncultured Alphaproteobacteria bacterium]